MSSPGQKSMPKPASKLVRPTALTQSRSSPTPQSIKTQALSLRDSQNDILDDYKIGDRVWVAGAKSGIIAFIGEVQFGAGEWAGVVLDSPVGKNDGSVNGIRYFMCEPKRGIFSRLGKLSRSRAPSKSSSPALSDDRLASSAEDGAGVGSAPPRTEPSSSAKAERSPSIAATVSDAETAGEVGSVNGDAGPTATAVASGADPTVASFGASKSLTSNIPSALPRRLSVSSHSSQGSACGVLSSQNDIPASIGDVALSKYAFKVGDRVKVSGSKKGTIQYLGDADFARGMWVGVELDDPLGKNNGSVAGKRYFDCKPMYGLFAPFHKVELLHEAAHGTTPAGYRRSSFQKTNFGDGGMSMSRDRTGSQDSISSIGSATSSASRSGRMRLGITSLAAQIGSKVRAPTYGMTPTVSALQKALKEKEEHVEQLLRERDVERADFIRTASGIEEIESKLSAKEAELVKYARESDEVARRLKASLEKLENEKCDLYDQLLDEKRKIEDLLFTVEEAAIDKSDVETQVEKYRKKTNALEENLRLEKEKVEKMSKDLETSKMQKKTSDKPNESVDDFLDQIEELTHKLFVAENQIKAMTENQKEIPADIELCQNCQKLVAAGNKKMADASGEDKSQKSKLELLMQALMSEQKISQDQIRTLRDDARRVIAEKESLQNEVSKFESERGKSKEKEENLMKENVSLKKQIQDLEKKMKEFASQVDKMKLDHRVEQEEMKQKLLLEIQMLQNSHRDQLNQKLKEYEKEKSLLKKAAEHSEETIKECETKIKQLQKEIERLQDVNIPAEQKRSSTILTSQVNEQETKLLQQRVRQLEKIVNESQTNANLLNNVTGSTTTTSSDSAVAALKADKEAAETQVEFLNSVIVEIQRKYVALESRLQAIDPSSSMTTSLIEGYSSNGTETRLNAPRLFCDICDVFDLHDTDDCPKQGMSNSPPASHHHGNRIEERPYCTNCEVFGHLTDNCTNEPQTY